jgi:NAD(P)-dependent dehydrogenase (short-subunit alcohol dehydrogenase family)
MLNRFVGSEENKKGFLQHIPLKRAGTPDEVAQTILFLASDKASYVTGQSIGVDGGRLAG